MPSYPLADLEAAGYRLDGDKLVRLTKPKGGEAVDRPLASRSAEPPTPRTRGTNVGAATAQDWSTPSPPLRSLSVPWRVLVSDNQRHGMGRGKIILTQKYRSALLQMRTVFASPCWRLMEGDIAVTVTLHEPNASRKRDLSNFSKLLHDAMIGTILVDDSQIQRMTYQRGPVDPENPRADITVSVL